MQQFRTNFGQYSIVKKSKPKSDESSGQRSPGWPPTDATTIEVYHFYLDFYVKDFTRTRLVVKSRASAVVISTAILAALTALVGAITTLTGMAWLGIVTVASSGAVTVLATWDSYFRHRELWAQRSSILNELQAMQRDYSLSLAAGDSPDEIARFGMNKLEALLARDLTSWLEIRKQVDDASDTKSGTPRTSS